jgi:hypothetical protein
VLDPEEAVGVEADEDDVEVVDEALDEDCVFDVVLCCPFEEGPMFDYVLSHLPLVRV